MDFNFQSNNSFLSLYHIEFSDKEFEAWQQLNRELEAVEYSADVLMNTLWEDLVKRCELVVDPGYVLGGTFMVTCKFVLLIVKSILVVTVLAVHLVST